MNTPILTLKNLKIHPKKGSSPLVDDIGFELNRGEILALVGESGSGKSITALAVMRLLTDALHIVGGQVMLGSDALFEMTESEMNRVRGRRIAMIFQEPQSALNPVQTVGEQLREVLTLHRNLSAEDTQADVLKLLDEVGIPDPQLRLNWYPHQLSGGQTQRVMIAMALACDPDVLIADEPTTALDVTMQKQVLELLQGLRVQRDLAILFITHDMAVVNQIADRVAVMCRGKIVETSRCDRFFRAPKHPYSQGLINALPNTDTYLRIEPDRKVLRVDNLRVWFPQRTGFMQKVTGYTKAVDGVSFHIGEGETLALVGESGCGKTTTGRAILRLCPRTRGQISFGNHVIHDLTDSAYRPYRRKIQIIFQDPYSSMNPRMTIGEIIDEGMRALTRDIPAKIRNDHIRNLMHRVGLRDEHLLRYPHEFSGGQRQRISIARALAVKPSLIICDEPTSALDVSLRSDVLDLLRELQEQDGIAYLFITHDLTLIPSFAHRVAVMKEGKIVEQGYAEEIMLRAEHPYSRELIAAAPKAPILLASASHD